MTTMHIYLFIEFEEYILKLESINQYSKLKIKFVDEVMFDFDFEIEEDMIFAKNSVAELILIDTMVDNRIESLECYNMELRDEGFECDSFFIKLFSGQELFFDPTYIFGINIGGKKQKESWLKDLPKEILFNLDKQTINLRNEKI